MLRRALVVLVLLFRTSAQPYQPKLWKLSSDYRVVYLLGSIHIGTPDMYPMARPIEDAFADSSTLLLEQYSSPDQPPPEALSEEFLKERAFYPPNDSLWKHISKDTRRRLMEFCETKAAKKFFLENGVDPEDLAQARPWFVAMTVDAAAALSVGMDMNLGVDDHFKTKAERAGKKIVGIETAEFQMKLLSGFPDELQVKWLESNLGMASDIEAMEKAMIADRNVHMADVAEEFLKTKAQTFMVVGSAHVDGVLQLLERRGYKVEEVPLKK